VFQPVIRDVDIEDSLQFRLRPSRKTS